MVPRAALISRIRAALARSRVVALVGPRQCGKTTLGGVPAPQGARVTSIWRIPEA